MNFADLVQIVWENLRAHRMRAVLTTIGIAIGIAGSQSNIRVMLISSIISPPQIVYK
jgi:hypothetical protein